MLPSYTSVVEQEAEEKRRLELQQQQQQQQQQNLDSQPQHQPPTFRQAYEGFHDRPEQQQQEQPHQSLRSTRPTRYQHQQQQPPSPEAIREGRLEMNSAFLQSPAGGLLAANTILGLVVAICGAIPAWSLINGGSFCVFSGLLHFAGSSFLFCAYLFGYVDIMPWFARPLALYYYFISAGFSLIAFVFSASSASSVMPAAIASAIFAFLCMAVDIVLTVLSYMALKLGYTVVDSSLETGHA